MSAIRERTTLCVVDLPKKLTSRRNLHAYFLKFGEVKNVSVNKDLKSGMIKFSSHFEAQAAKTQGKMYEGEPLKIYWSESTTVDPRAKEKKDMSVEINEMWDDDDKECFGVEFNQGNPKEEHKQSAKSMIKQHLKMANKQKLKPEIELRMTLGKEKSKVKREDGSVLQKFTVKLRGSKSSSLLKKSIINPIVKQKVVRKEEISSRLGSNKQKKSLIKELSSKTPPVSSNIESTDLKLKLALLDERDKLIRKGMIQNSNIKTAVAIKGTCPDMCPERERILRQRGHAVATYELIPGTNEMDENRAVKEYIRSSADQEVPLPHDLRPEPVLSRTMNYLITNIITRIDNTDENKAIWYSFCWNRLRSIRKDIILQQLCDLETVTIVEQCARFHICCYDHMWGAEVSGFDDKINTQNLIDCLQTLKHMYEDLAKHGVRCNNESEFYSYLILLKLTTGDVMWEYQQYSLNIQLSEQVQFAIEAYMAFKNNMYARYFHLVKKASYLTACLMQRYFDEVRTQALKTMLKAYCLPNKNVGLSSSFIVSSLRFDSTKNALSFCEREEVDVKVDSDDIEDVYVLTSSFLIKEKRLPIANAVVGINKPIPEYIPHQVHSSFDESGRLLSSPIIKSDENNEDSNLSDGIAGNENANPDDTDPDTRDKSTFKFSLSPTVVTGDIFGKTLFSNKPNFKQDQSSIDNCMNSNQQTIMNVSYDDHKNKMFEVKEDKDEVMVYEGNEMAQKPIYNSFQITKTGNEISCKPQFGLEKHFLIPPFTSFNETNISSTGKENEAIKENTTSLTGTKDSSSYNLESKNSSVFSFSTNVTDKVHSDINVHDVQKTAPKETYSFLESDSANDNSMPSGQIDHKIILPDVKPKELGRKKVLEDETDNKECQQAKEKEFKALLLQKLLQEKVEQERLQFEENQRLEQIRKENEEKVYYRFLKKDVRQRCKVISARKCARIWRLKIEKVKKTRADFPLLFQLSVKDHLSKWGSMNAIPTSKILLRARNQRNKIRIISQLLNSGVTDSCRYLGNDLAETLAKSAARTMNKAAIKPVYWKLAFSVPHADNSCSALLVFNQLMKKWCKQSFYKQEEACLGSVERVLTSLEIPVNMSIHLSDTVESKRELQGMDALVFVVLNEAETVKTCIQRLNTLMSSQIKGYEFSVVVMNVGGANLESVLKLQLKELQEKNIVAHWKTCSWSDPKSIVDSLHFLADQVDVTPYICASSLEVLIKQVSEEFFDALSCNQHSNEALSNTLKNPNNVIRLYNICLIKLEDLLKSSKLEKYFNIAEDFRAHIPKNESGGPELLCGKLYDDVYKNNLKELMNSLKLPELSKWPVRSPNRLVKMIKAYCNQVHDFGIFPQIIRMLDLPDEGDLQQHLQHVSWLNIIELWAQCNIRHVLCSKDKSKRFFVIYNKNNVQKLIQMHWWLKHPIVMK